MGISQRQVQKLQQTLSPQQIQMIKLLELPAMQLEQRIKQEVEDNIVLEEDATPEEEQEKISVDDYIRGDDTPGYKSRVNNYSKDEKQRPMNISEGRSMQEYLTEQLGYRNLSDRDMRIASFLVGSIDSDGYLRRDLESISDDIAFSLGIETTVDELERLLGIIHQLEPAGIGARNLHDMRGACLACGLGEDVAAKLCALLGCGGSEEQKLSLLCSLFPGSAECAAAARELSLAVRSLEQGGARAEIDFSLSDDPAYYNGIVFRGYGENFPGTVLTGGRYDNLVKKFGAGSGGIGFALCADAFEGARRQFDADVLLLYGEGADPQKVLLRARRIAAEGESVYAAKRVPEAMKFARTEKMD